MMFIYMKKNKSPRKTKKKKKKKDDNQYIYAIDVEWNGPLKYVPQTRAGAPMHREKIKQTKKTRPKGRS